AAVLADDDAGHRFEHLAGAHHRPGVELLRGDRALTRRLGDAERFSAGRSASAMFVNVRLPVTVTSALSERCSTASTRADAPTATTTSRRAVAKLGSVNVS